ncbi:hypothetical protein PCANC_18725 [Puccinia coronata f. sp. avenae]|uniref:Uncharacterized protein n=1 Tax=Puccinia coronata f. sp. avenae TaxID=200324 RepID=A0A2N5UAR8_9BASI|nr:hypothetical protein PCANC_26130 [Puccinia coronata f. sp. avenae]PLW11360.1 hypothetical protein PCASD_24322 [Puccinia coronata f. sp. avenae]PLW34837.1 hypothetical protein PCANC_18725 [Puccinia coronata f. sp. avenae]
MLVIVDGHPLGLAQTRVLWIYLCTHPKQYVTTVQLGANASPGGARPSSTPIGGGSARAQGEAEEVHVDNKCVAPPQFFHGLRASCHVAVGLKLLPIDGNLASRTELPGAEVCSMTLNGLDNRVMFINNLTRFRPAGSTPQVMPATAQSLLIKAEVSSGCHKEWLRRGWPLPHEEAFRRGLTMPFTEGDRHQMRIYPANTAKPRISADRSASFVAYILLPTTHKPLTWR